MTEDIKAETEKRLFIITESHRRIGYIYKSQFEEIISYLILTSNNDGVASEIKELEKWANGFTENQFKFKVSTIEEASSKDIPPRGSWIYQKRDRV